MDHTLHIHTEEIQEDGKDNFHFHRYEPTPYPVLDTLFSHLTIQSTDVLVDYGSGLGRLNFYTANRFHCQSIGIEMVPDYYQRAMENKKTFYGDSDLLDFRLCAAEDYVVCPKDNYFYFFNPFSLAIFRKVIHQILLSYEENSKDVTLVLYYPEDEVLFYLEQHTNFILQDEIAASDDVVHDRRERFCIYFMPGCR